MEVLYVNKNALNDVGSAMNWKKYFCRVFFFFRNDVDILLHINI